MTRALTWALFSVWVVGSGACDDARPGAATSPSATGAPSSGEVASAAPAPTGRGSAEPPAARASLTFAIGGKTVRSLSQRELVEAAGTTTFTAYDPYYSKPKTYRALPLAKVLALGFDGQDLELRREHFVLRAKDGYTVPIEGKRLLEDGAHIAIDDVDTPDGWQPIGPQQVSPAPFYLVWERDDQRDLSTHPRPWQLATIEISKFEASFPNTVPTGEPETSPAWAGFTLFREQCIRCHAINQEGGNVGPELNVPQSIVEYRPIEQVRAYIKNPRTFRYGNMPANPHLDEDDLDSLIAYFQAMKGRKQDPSPPPSDH